ncbi:MAG: PadR family transcriptional regulator [Planctomycetaceae bacterium]|nr:PadR family transcriptional regulator [Planctomycetaceae bacterium]
MLITSNLIRGHIETIILAHLVSGDSYGYEMNRSVQEKSGGKYELKEATLYSAFRRLENGQQIRSYWGDETTGARRRYYAITETGRKTYAQNLSDWEKAKVLIDQLIHAPASGEPQ